VIDFRTDEGVREAFKTVAGWNTPADTDGDAAPILTLHAARPQDRRRPWLAGAAAVLVLAIAAAVVTREAGQPFAAAQGDWAAMTASPLAARFAPIGLWTGDELIVWGGHDASGEEYLDGAAYDPSTDTWRQIADFPFPYERREGAGVNEAGSWVTHPTPGAWFQGRALFVVATGEEPWAWDIVAYDPVADSWEMLDSARFDQQPNDELVLREGSATVQSPTGMAAFDGQLYVFGWHSGRNEYGWSTFDPASRTWSAFTGIPGSGKLSGEGAVPSAPLVIDRHLVWVRQRAFNDGRPMGYSVDLRSGSIVNIESPVDGTFVRMGDVATDGVATGIVGMNSSVTRRFAARLNPATGQWTELSAPPNGANDEDAYGQLVTANDTTLLIGGVDWNLETGGLKATPAQLALDPADGSWHQLPDAPIDLSRTDHVTAWTGRELLVWGGATAADPDHNRIDAPLDNGARYIP
jgi:hypothetical protein